MESDNPFLQRIHVDEEELNNYEGITPDDVGKYPLRGQNIKFSHPEKFRFIDIPIEFIALETDDESNVKSVLVYLDTEEDMLEFLSLAFGNPDLKLDIEGETEPASRDEKQSYASYTWIIEGYRMTFSLIPVKVASAEYVPKPQLYIKQ